MNPATTLKEWMQRAGTVVALTGAGVSTRSGIPDFRGPQGLYKNPDAERIFDIAWFRKDPGIYYQGCRELIYGLSKYQPNPIHFALAKLEQRGMLQAIITQNIDMLHQKAGSARVVEIHGSPRLHHCVGCGEEATFDAVCKLLENGTVAHCGHCGQVYKPDITFFGERLPEQALDAAIRLAEHADLMLVLGTSLTVQPAASLPGLTLQAGGNVIIVNAQPTPLDTQAVLRMPDLAAFACEVEALLA